MTIQTNDGHLHRIAAKDMRSAHQPNTIGAGTSGTQSPNQSVYQAHYFSNSSTSPIHQSHQKTPSSLQKTELPTRSKCTIPTTCVKMTSRHCIAWSKYSNKLPKQQGSGNKKYNPETNSKGGCPAAVCNTIKRRTTKTTHQ